MDTEAILTAWQRELPAALTPTSELSKRVLELGRALTAAVVAAVAPFGLTPAEYDVLAALRRTGAPFRLTPTALAAELLLSSGGVTKALHGLGGRGLVTREPDPDDRRRSHVRLTPDGVELAERAVLASTAAQHRLLGRAPGTTTDEAAEALRRVAENLA